MSSIGGSIINSLGAGSGLNSTSLVEQLTDIERMPKQNKIDTRKESYETQLSDFGILRSALSLLQETGNALSNTATFNSKTASFSDSSAFIPVSLSENVPTGNYSFEVLEVARSQSLASGASYASASDTVGKGTLTLDFGSWDDPNTFTANADKEPLVITIDDSNNSLTGLRDAINKADAGVSASIVNDGSGYRLLLTAESGQSNQLQITASEEADAAGLAAFNFNDSQKAMDQAQAGQDARLKINGMEVTRSSNDIDDVLPGFRFNLAKPDPGNVVNVSISEDKAGGEQALRDFVDSFNAFLEAVQPAVGFNSETEADGSLKRDPAARAMMAQIRNLIASSMGGLEQDFTSLSSVGIRTQNDGTLKIDETTFQRAFAENYDQVKALFTPQASSNAEGITVSGYRTDAKSGNYDVVITQQPQQGNLTGVAASASLRGDLSDGDTEAGAFNFQITVNGVKSDVIEVALGDYASHEELAAHLQAQINNDEKLKGAKAAVNVVWQDDHFEIVSRDFGSKSNVSVVAVGDKAADLGLDSGTSTSGKDVAGTFNGVAGFGSGQVLLPSLGTDAYGISLIVQPGTTEATINFSRGFGAELSKSIDTYLMRNGVLDKSKETLEGKIKDLKDDQTKLDTRMEAYYNRLLAQFMAMENIINGLNSSGSALDNIGDYLPFTAKRS